MFSIMILICSLAIARANCTMETASDHLTATTATLFPTQCLMAGEILAAHEGMKPNGGQYMKISCYASSFVPAG